MEAFIIVIIVVSVLLPLLIVFRVLRTVRGGSKKERAAKQAQIQQLMATGSKARATITAINPTGMIVNHINIQCNVDFRLDPLDGSADFTGQKQMFINQTQMPRVGDVWPCWYDRNDTTVFAVGMPDGASEEQLPVFREFGIPHPLDQSIGSETVTTPTGPPAAPASGDDRVDDLEMLADLHSRGLLSKDEFESEKRRLLGN